MVYDTSSASRAAVAQGARARTGVSATASSPCAVYLSPVRAFQSRIGLIAADSLVIAVASDQILAHRVELGQLGQSRLVLALALLSIFAFVVRACRLYELRALQTIPRALTAAGQTAAVSAAALTVFAVSTGAPMSLQGAGLAWATIVACGLFLVRLGYFGILGWFPEFFKERVLLIGNAGQVRGIHREVIDKRCEPSLVVGFVAIGDGIQSAPYPLLGRLKQIDSLSTVAEVDRVIIIDDGTDPDLLADLAPKLRATSFEVGILVPNLTQLRVAKSYALSRYNTFLLQTPPLSVADRFLKRLEDLVLGCVLLAVSLPLMGLIAVAIKLTSPGPAIFRQRRWGFNGKSFDVYKFRTMRLDAAAPTGGSQATRGDPRVTRVGHVSRRTSLDELPQFFNVIKGDMSLIGPRPHAVDHNEFYAKAIDGYLARHHVRPGMSGWAQVNGCRGETRTLAAMQRRLDHDLHYIARWSMRLDVYILIRTIFTVLSGRNAY